MTNHFTLTFVFSNRIKKFDELSSSRLITFSVCLTILVKSSQRGTTSFWTTIDIFRRSCPRIAKARKTLSFYRLSSSKNFPDSSVASLDTSTSSSLTLPELKLHTMKLFNSDGPNSVNNGSKFRKLRVVTSSPLMLPLINLSLKSWRVSPLDLVLPSLVSLFFLFSPTSLYRNSQADFGLRLSSRHEHLALEEDWISTLPSYLVFQHFETVFSHSRQRSSTSDSSVVLLRCRDRLHLGCPRQSRQLHSFSSQFRNFSFFPTLEQ